MAVDYTPGTSGSMAVAKSMPITGVNAVGGDEDVDYADGQSSMPLIKPVMSPNINVVRGNVTATQTGDVGIG